MTDLIERLKSDIRALLAERWLLAQQTAEPGNKTDWDMELSSWNDDDFVRVFHECPNLADRLRKILAEPVKCAGCEGKPAPGNNPCAVCGKESEPDKQHPDDVAVDAFAAAMKAKLKRAREEKGRGGWQDMSATKLSAMLREHVEKSDPVDVANLAMMLHQNGQVIEPPATVVTDEMVEALRAEVERVTCELMDVTTRADKLAEALRHQRWCRTCAEDGWESCEEGRKNDALLRERLE